MIFSMEIKVSIFLLFILTVTTVAKGDRCSGTVDYFSRDSGAVYSPNFGHEYGNIENCSWGIRVPENAYLVLNVDKLKLHFTDFLGSTLCTPAYILKINGERLGCDPPQLTDRRNWGNDFCMQYENPRCMSRRHCKAIRKIKDRVVIVYKASGSTRSFGEWFPRMTGFRIRYTLLHCQPIKTPTVRRSTNEQRTEPQSSSIGTTPWVNVSVTPNTVFATMPTMRTATMADDSVPRETIRTPLRLFAQTTTTAVILDTSASPVLPPAIVKIVKIITATGGALILVLLLVFLFMVIRRHIRVKHRPRSHHIPPIPNDPQGAIDPAIMFRETTV